MSDTVDLRPLYNAIRDVGNTLTHQVESVSHQIGAVENQIEGVAREQATTRQRVEDLYEEFREYVERDEWDKVVSTAQQDKTHILMQIEKDFGLYAEVRDHATGILQSVDDGIVRAETIRTRAEELKLRCGKYWLASAIIAMSAWISDNRSLAEDALAIALQRDDSKASLFFALICRRARRSESCSKWLVRYFQIQNPVAMDREVVVMLDALANGLFGGGALIQCSNVIDQWMNELEQQAGFPEEQRKRWVEALDVMTPQLQGNEYPTLRKYSTTWPKLEATLASARRNQVVLSFFENMFTGEIVVSPRLEADVDELLNKLVTRFDDEELPLQRDLRRQEIMIEVNKLPGRPSGKKTESDRRYAAESDALEEQTSFAALLTNSAMYPERYGATRATQRYSVSRSRQWVIAGFSDLTARDRARVVTDVEIACGSWKDTSRDGSNEQQLSSDLTQHYARRIEQAVNGVGITPASWAVLAIGGLLGLAIAAQGGGAIVIGLLGMAGAGAYFYFQYQNLDKTRQQVREALERERDSAMKILKAALAELADFRRETAKEDQKSEKVVVLLQSLSSPQFILKRQEQGRTIVA